MLTSSLGTSLIAIPWAMYLMGVYWGMGICCIMAYNSHYVNRMYIKSGQLLPNKFASVFEISYLLYGKVGYIVSCFMFTSMTFGLLIIYNLTVAENFSILVSSHLGVDPKWKKYENSLDRDSDLWIRLVTSQTFYIICLTLM